MAHHIEHTKRVRVPAEKIWAILKDFKSIERTSHAVESSPILAGPASGLGTKRRCHFYDKKSVVEEIIEYKEGSSFKIELSEFSMPLKSAIAEFTVKKVNANDCDISMSMDFVVKAGPIGWLLGATLMKPVLTNKVLKNELIGLAYHAATGKLVGTAMPSSKETAAFLI